MFRTMEKNSYPASEESKKKYKLYSEKFTSNSVTVSF
jgi:hypothetical protein